MVTQQEWADILNLKQAGFSVREISLRKERSLKTVYQLLRNNGPKVLEKIDKGTPKALLKHQEYLNLRIKNGVTNASKLEQELRDYRGFTGSYYLVNQYVKVKLGNSFEHKRADKNFLSKRLTRTKYKPSIRFETEPGQQAQVDWGHFGRIEINGRTEKLYCFSYILGYSRYRYMEFTIKQNSQTLIQCHLNAFNRLGIAKEIVYDNMKTVVSQLQRLPDGTLNANFNPLLMNFAKYYGFKISPTAPYWPKAKGKVERGFKYIRGNFMQGLKIGHGLKSLEELNEIAQAWTERVANVKPNKTTNEKPITRWLLEKPFLDFPSKLPPYNISGFCSRFCGKDGTIEYKSCVYPVPKEFTRKTLFIKEVNLHGLAIIELYYESELLAKYYVSRERHKWISESEAVFFKSSPVKEPGKKRLIKINTPKSHYPVVASRPLSYYKVLLVRQRGILDE